MRDVVVTLFEHETLRVDGEVFRDSHLVLLDRWVAAQKSPPLFIGRRHVKFSSYVGVIRVAGLTIEILPKIERQSLQGGDESKSRWRNALIRMLEIARVIRARPSTSSNVSTTRSSLLDYLFAIYLEEVSTILDHGLTNDYTEREENGTKLRGRIVFPEHIRRNGVHQERNYCRFVDLTQDNPLNRLLKHVCGIIANSAVDPRISARAAQLMLRFAEVSDATPSLQESKRHILKRRFSQYSRAFGLAELIVQRSVPELSHGPDRVLAVLFDMNLLFETYVYKLLRKAAGELSDVRVKAQRGRRFWQTRLLRPDIIIEHPGGRTVLDTKWKIPKDNRPSDADLRQMYAYSHVFGAHSTHLVYPSTDTSFESIAGVYMDGRSCSVARFPLFENGEKLRTEAVNELSTWCR